MNIKTIEDAKKEMAIWEGVNKPLYKQALYAYNQLIAQGEKPVEEKVEIKKEVTTEKKYTKEDLKEIAEKKGITGLRRIGKKFGCVFRAIDEGIREILGAQK